VSLKIKILKRKEFFLRKLFQKLGFMKGRENDTELDINVGLEEKEIQGSEKLDGIVHHWEKKENTLRGTFFAKDE
jgi:hypothetical protein